MTMSRAHVSWLVLPPVPAAVGEDGLLPASSGGAGRGINV
jgi:hypothetical protein